MHIHISTDPSTHPHKYMYISFTCILHTHIHTHHTRAVHFIALYFISLHYTTLEYACWTFPNILTKTGRSLTIPHSIYLRIITWPAFPKVCSNILPQVAVHLGVFSPSRSKYDAVALACCCAQKLLTLGKNCENPLENHGKLWEKWTVCVGKRGQDIPLYDWVRSGLVWVCCCFGQNWKWICIYLHLRELGQIVSCS